MENKDTENNNNYMPLKVINAWQKERKEVAIVTTCGVYFGKLVAFGNYEITLALENSKPLILFKGNIAAIMSKKNYLEMNKDAN